MFQIERLLPTSGYSERRELNHLFHHNSEKSVTESHLWLSIFLRSRRSRSVFNFVFPSTLLGNFYIKCILFQIYKIAEDFCLLFTSVPLHVGKCHVLWNNTGDCARRISDWACHPKCAADLRRNNIKHNNPGSSLIIDIFL